MRSAQAGARARVQVGAEARRRQGRAGGRGAQAAGARRRWGARGALGKRPAGAGRRADAQAGVACAAGGRWGAGLGARPGRAGWPWDVHSVHSACFWPGSTRYFPESKFLDIVREPGS